MKNILLLIALFSFFVSKSFAQFSVSAGPSFIKGFGIEGVYPGFHISGEISNDDVQTMYARLSFMGSKKGEYFPTVVYSISQLDNPYNIQLNAREKFNYSILELGKRYYFGEGYESGFGVYGGTNLTLVFNKVSYEFDEYDEQKYQADFATKGSVVGIAFGVGGGIKNSFSFGTVYFDTGLSYRMFSTGSADNLATPDQLRSVFFNFNLGIRKDFY